MQLLWKNSDIDFHRVWHKANDRDTKLSQSHLEDRAPTRFLRADESPADQSHCGRQVAGWEVHSLAGTHAILSGAAWSCRFARCVGCWVRFEMWISNKGRSRLCRDRQSHFFEGKTRIFTGSTWIQGLSKTNGLSSASIQYWRNIYRCDAHDAHICNGGHKEINVE